MINVEDPYRLSHGRGHGDWVRLLRGIFDGEGLQECSDGVFGVILFLVNLRREEKPCDRLQTEGKGRSQDKFGQLNTCV